MPIITPPDKKISWPRIRRGLKETIIAAAPNARVHSRWALKYDIESTLAYLHSVNPLTPEDIHAWMVSVYQVQPEEVKTGSSEYDNTLGIRVWGFRGFEFGDDEDNSQDPFEDEVDNVVAFLKANRLTAFGISEEDGRKYLRDITLPAFELDVAGFGEGYDVHVAKGTMTMRVAR